LTVFVVAYGETFAADLLSKQALVVTEDVRQLGEWVVRGRYPVGIGLTYYQVREFQNAGVGLNVEALEAPRELTMAGGGIQLLKNAPHPNAAKVYINWLLSPKTQTMLSQATLYNSRRLDVPLADPTAVIDPGRLDQYIYHQSEQLLPFHERAQELAARILR
jgi:ABC-type Fe3+ transport system substrate-binding protein